MHDERDIEFFCSGNVDEDTIFTYDSNTDVYGSCAATLNDEFCVIGSRGSEKRQVRMK